MEAKKRKRLVLIGIHRKGEKGFKKTIRVDREKSLPLISPTKHLCEFADDRINKYPLVESQSKYLE